MAIAQARRTRCPSGHPYDLVSGGRRRCLRCARERYQPRPVRTRAEILWARTRPDSVTGCWQWVGSMAVNGYGRYGYPSAYAHRLMYELIVGPIPEGLVIDHLCRNRGCVNPAHLECVTLAENVKRGAASRRAER